MVEDLKLDCLLNSTRDVLQRLIQNEYMKNFVLVGGSALSLHLCHRLSEDLDFFTYEDSFDMQIIKLVIKDFEDKKIVNISDEQIDVFLNGVKVTFFNAKWKFLEPKQPKTFNVATLKQIVIMKTNLLFLRAKYRDYYDLYFLSKYFSLKQMYKLSENILDGLNFKLFSSALLYIEDIEDENIEHLKPIESISLKKIRQVFEMKLKKEANL